MAWADNTAAIRQAARASFGESFVYSPKAGGSFDAVGVFGAPGLQLQVSLEVQVESAGPAVGALARASDGVEFKPVRDDRMQRVKDGKHYLVRNVVPDGEGDWAAMLVEVA